LGNCSTNECKFIIFVLKNFNGKFFHLIITKLGVRTLMPLLQPPLLQQIIHISHRFFFFSFSKLYILTNEYVFFFFCLRTYINTLVFLRHSYTYKKTCIFFFFSFFMFMISIYFFFLCWYDRLSAVSSLWWKVLQYVYTEIYHCVSEERKTSDL
jgi:hypothetical protein